MKLAKYAVMLAIACFYTTAMQAQFIDKLKKKVEKNVENRAVNQVDKGVDKSLDKTEEAIWNSLFGVKKSEMDSLAKAAENDPEAQKQMMEIMALGKNNVPIADEYSFQSQMVYKMSTNFGGKETVMDYTMFINPEAEYMATQMGTMESGGEKSNMPMGMTTILDYENEAMIMIMEEQKMAQIMSMDMLNKNLNTDKDIAEKQNEMTIIKTGKTKEILGYDCEEYQVSSEDTNGSLWIAPQMEAFNHSFFKNMGNHSFADNTQFADLKGMMMEMDMTVKERKNKKESDMKMNIVSISKQSTVIVMANYQTIGMIGSAKK